MIKISRLHYAAATVVTVLLATATLYGCDSAGAGSAVPSANVADLGLFRDVLKQVEKSYVDPVTSDELVRDALKGMLTRLDPHSDYMDQEQYQQMTAVTRGQFGGIGRCRDRTGRPDYKDRCPADDRDGCRGDRQTTTRRAWLKGDLDDLAQR